MQYYDDRERRLVEALVIAHRALTASAIEYGITGVGVAAAKALLTNATLELDMYYVDKYTCSQPVLSSEKGTSQNL